MKKYLNINPENLIIQKPKSYSILFISEGKRIALTIPFEELLRALVLLNQYLISKGINSSIEETDIDIK